MKPLLFILFFLLSGLAAWGQPTDTLEIEERIEIADSLFDELGDYQQAISYYKHVAADFRARSKREKYLIYQLKVIQCYYLLSQYAPALHLAEQLLKNIPKNLPGNYRYEGQVQTLIGEIYFKKGEYTIAKEYLHKALWVLKYEYGAEVQLSETYSVLGFVNEAVENFDIALKYYKRALSLRKRILGNYHQATALSYADLANVHFAKGDYTASINYDLQSLKIKKYLYGESHPEIARSYNNIASIYTARGDFDIALNYHQKALTIRKQLFGDLHIDLGQSYNNIGYNYMQKGAYDLALEYYHRYETILQALVGKYHPNLSTVYTNIGTIYIKKKQYDKALEYFERNLWLLRGAYSKQNTHFADAYYNFGYAYRLKKDYPKAIAYFKQALQIMRKVFDKPHINTARAYLNLGRAYADSKKTNLAAEYFGLAVNILKKLFGNKASLLSESVYELGKLYLNQQQYNKALHYLQQALVYGVARFDKGNQLAALPRLKDFALDPFMVKVLSTKARCLYNIYTSRRTNSYLDQAMATYELSYALLRKVENSYLKAEDRIRFNETVLTVREGAIKAYRQKYKTSKKKKHLSKMFDYSEQFKANTLKSSLNHEKALKSVGIPPVYIIEEKGLRLEINHWQTKIANNPQKNAQYQDSLFKYNRKYENLITLIRKNYPKYALLKDENKTTKLSDIQRKLKSGSVLLEYSFGEKGSYLFIITKTMVKVVDIIDRKNLQPLLDAYYHALEGEERLPKFSQASYQVYRALLASAEPYFKGKKRLIIIAPSLESVPFEAIITHQPAASLLKTNHFFRLPYLIKQYQVNYHYSATLWYRGLGYTKKAKPRLIAYAPFSTGKSEVLNSEAIRQAADSLPESGVEVKAIFKLFRKKQLNAKVFLASAATKESFVHKAKNYNIIHIASHSEANIKNANLAKVYFAPEKTQLSASRMQLKRSASSCLYASEVHNMTLNADLLVLSSCESGVGKLAKGEGVLSLARSFLYAGARNIVFSLWEVNDTYTRKLMVAFYKALLSGKSYRAALQTAQQTNLHADKTLHPKHWAGFVMIGE